MIPQENDIIRLGSIDAALKNVDLPQKFKDEKNEIIEKLRLEKMIVVENNTFVFVDKEAESIYEDSLNQF